MQSDPTDLRLTLGTREDGTKTDHRSIFCCKLLPSVTENKLRDAFKRFGRLTEAEVNKRSHKGKCSGFVSFARASDAEAAYDFAVSSSNGIFADGDRIIVQWYKVRKQKRQATEDTLDTVLKRQVIDEMPPYGMQLGTVCTLLYGPSLPQPQQEQARAHVQKAGGALHWVEQFPDFEVTRTGSSTIWVAPAEVASPGKRQKVAAAAADFATRQREPLLAASPGLSKTRLYCSNLPSNLKDKVNRARSQLISRAHSRS